MLELTCPCCGVSGEETEFAQMGEAHLTRFGPDSSDEDFEAYMFMRANPKGVHFEQWRHIYGCGKFFHLARNSVTLQIYGSYKAQTLKPPAALINKIKKIYPNWEGPQ